MDGEAWSIYRPSPWIPETHAASTSAFSGNQPSSSRIGAVSSTGQT